MGVTEVLTTEFRATGQGSVLNVMNGLAGGASNYGAAMGLLAGGIGIVAGAVVAAGTYAVKTAAQFETLRIQMDTVFGSAAAGKDAFSWAVQFAKDTPFHLEQVIELMTRMKAMEMDPFGQLGRIGDAALGDFDRAQRIVTALGQMQVKSFVSGEELRQLTEAGIPAMRLLADKFKLDPTDFNNIGNLRIPASEAIEVILKGMDAKFKGGMGRSMDSLSGKISNVKDSFAVLGAAIGNEMLPIVKSLADQLITLLGGTTNLGTTFHVMSLWFEDRWLNLLLGLDVLKLAFTEAAYALAKIAAIGTGNTSGLQRWGSTMDATKADIAKDAAIIDKHRGNWVDWALELAFGTTSYSGGGKGKGAQTGGKGTNLAEQFILGGGERLRSGVRGLDIARGISSAPAAIPIRLQVEGENSPLGQAFKRLAEQVFGQGWAQLSRDPKFWAALKTA